MRVRCFAARFECRADRQQAAEFAMRARLRAHRHGGHAGQRRQPVHQVGDQRQRALHRLLRLQRMEIAEARQPRHLLVEAGIVLHRAGAQRIEPRIDRVVHPRQAHIMAHHFRLRESRQADRRRCAAARPAAISDNLHLRNIDAGHARAAEFEDQRLFVIKAAIAGDRGESRRLAPRRAALGRPWLFIVMRAPPRAPRERVAIFVGCGFGGGHDQEISRAADHAASGAMRARRRGCPSPPAHRRRLRRAWAASA